MEIDNSLWVDVSKYEGLYQVHPDGHVRSLPRYGKEGNILEGGLTGKDRKYKAVNLCRNSKCKSYKVHRLVAETFIPNPENKPQVNHIDGNTFNNNVSNLEWVTNKENSIHAWENGLKENVRRSLIERNKGNNYAIHLTKYFNFINKALSIIELNVSPPVYA